MQPLLIVGAGKIKGFGIYNEVYLDYFHPAYDTIINKINNI